MNGGGAVVVWDAQALADRFVDWLYEQAGANTSNPVKVEPFMTEVDIDVAAALNLVRDAARRGLVRNDNGLSEPAATLTFDGVRTAQDRQRLRADPAQRNAAARTGLLRWLYEQEHAGVRFAMTDGMLTTEHATFGGGQLVVDDAARAGQYLRDKGLIRGNGGLGRGGLLHAALTADGIECVEQHAGNVGSYLGSRDGTGSTTYGRGMANGFEINRRGVARMAKEIEREFAKHPIQVPVQAAASTPGAGVAGSTTIYGTVIYGNADGAQLAWGNRTVTQTQQQRTDTITAGFEPLAQAVVSTLERLPAAGLNTQDLSDAEAAANEVLTEVTQPEPDRGRIRRALTTLKGYLAPVAMGLSVGAGAGAEEWAKTAITHLGGPF